VIRPKPKPTNTSGKSLKPNHSAKSNERRREIVRAAYQTLAEKDLRGSGCVRSPKERGLTTQLLRAGPHR
jgi:hypothetical protein